MAPLPGRQPARDPAAAKAGGNLRWWIAGVICLGMSVNYLDRQVLSVLAPEIRDTFQLSNSDYARIVFAFQLSYMLSSAAGGRLAAVGVDLSGLVVFPRVAQVRVDGGVMRVRRRITVTA